MKSKAQILKDSGIDLRSMEQDNLMAISNAMETYADQSIDYFVDELFSALKRRGIDTSNWDGDEGVIETLATCIAEDRQEYADQFRNENKYSRFDLERAHIAGWNNIDFEEWFTKDLTPSKADEK